MDIHNWCQRRAVPKAGARNPRSISQFFSKKVFVRWSLPYGQWSCADGREVLFDRTYTPLVQRYPGQAATMADPCEWIAWEDQRWLYDDSVPEQEKRRRAVAVLEQWGVAKVVLDAAETLHAFTKRQKSIV